jgi:hypothetical protein
LSGRSSETSADVLSEAPGERSSKPVAERLGEQEA